MLTYVSLIRHRQLYQVPKENTMS